MQAQAACFDGFTEDEIADAYEICIMNQQEFLSDTEGGKYLRREVLKHFRDRHPDCKTIEQLAIWADLENDVDVKNACNIRIDAEKYADMCLNP